MTLKESKSRHTSLLLFLNLLMCPNLSFSLTPNHGHCKHTCGVQNDEWQLCAHFNSLLCTIVVVLDNNYDEVLVRKIQGKILLSQI